MDFRRWAMKVAGYDGTSTSSIGVWLPRSGAFRSILCQEIESQRPQLDVNICVYTDNHDGLLSDDLYDYMSTFPHLLLVACSFKYTTCLTRALVKKRKGFSEGEFACQSPMSPFGLLNDFIELSDSSDGEFSCNQGPHNYYYPALGFILIENNDVTGTGPRQLTEKIKTDIDAMKTLLPELRLVLVLNGVKEFLIHTSDTNDGHSPTIQIHPGTLDELTCSLLIEHQIDTIDVEDEPDLARQIVKVCKSIQACSRRGDGINDFKAKPHAYLDADTLPSTKVWITQLLQIPDVGKDVAKTIAAMYPSPAAIIKALAKSPEEFIDSIKNITIHSKRVGPSIAKRIAKLYSNTLVPDEKVYEQVK